MKIEINKKRYILIRKIMKGVIILFFILILLAPLVEIIIEIEADCYIDTNGGAITGFSIYDRIFYSIWGHNFSIRTPTAFLILHPLYWFGLVFYWIGFFLSFGNIKRNYKNQIIKRNIGNVSGLLILLGMIGMVASAIGSTDVGFADPSVVIYSWSRRDTIGNGTHASIIMLILIFGETFFLNRVKIISEVKKEEYVKEEPPKRETREIVGKVFCSSCGAEILDKTGDFCSKCGAPFK